MLFRSTEADEFIKGDLRNLSIVDVCVDGVDEIYQLAADMGGADFIFTGEHDSDIMHNSAMINLNIVDSMKRLGIKKVFYSSSACMYPEDHQLEIDVRSEEHTSELQSRRNLVCRLLLEKKKKIKKNKS